MSDLSDFVNMDFATGTPPQVARAGAVEKARHAPFRWPTPPFAAYPDAAEQQQAQACEYVGTHGRAVAGRLIFFVPEDGVAHVQVPPARTTTLLRFSQFRSLRVMAPLKPVSTALLTHEKHAHMLEQRPRSPYRITLVEGGALEGQTIGHVESEHGLFLFPPVDDKGSVQRLFVPRCAYTQVEIGPRIGQVLVQQRAATSAQVEQAADVQKQLRGQAQAPADNQVPLGELLVQMGMVSPDDLQAALAHKMGYPLVNLDAFPFEDEAVQRLPRAVAQRLQVMPLMLREGRLVVALDDPVRRRVALDEVERITQLTVVPVLARCQRLDDVLATAYERTGPTEPEAPAGAGAPEPAAGGHPAVAQLVQQIIIDAAQAGVSDIHIESYPGRDPVKVRFRQDGLLRTHLELPHPYRHGLIECIKAMCELDVAECRKPQDGKLAFARFSPQHPVELRVATIPTDHGLEDVVMSLLASAKPMPLDDLGLSPWNLQQLKEAMERPYGLLLCAGPTGAGKTTTLHSALSHINVPERKIWTAEDPVEITQPGLRQVQVNPKADWTYARALRAFLRADPDVIMVGEMRDPETAQMAVEAALSGHLVLSALHTGSASETVTRLCAIGLDRFNFADALLGVLAQRLVRRLCPHCRASRPASENEINELLDDYLHVCPGEHPTLNRKALRADWAARHGRGGPLLAFHSPGCEHCGHTGHQGRAGLHELLVVTRELRRLIQAGAHAEDLQRAAMLEGMRTLRQDGIEKVLQGTTSLAEVRASGAA